MEAAGRWKTEEINFLKTHYHLKSANDIAEGLGRTRDMVYKKAQHLRLRKVPRWRMPEVKKVVELLNREGGRPSQKEIANELGGRSAQGVEGMILRYKLLPKSSQETC